MQFFWDHPVVHHQSPHTFPQPPQLSGSESVFTHAPPHMVQPGLHTGPSPPPSNPPSSDTGRLAPQPDATNRPTRNPQRMAPPLRVQDTTGVGGPEGRVTLTSSRWDPLGDIPVNRVKQIVYGRYNNTMLPGRVVGRVWNPLRFVKHAFFKTDFVHAVLDRFDPSQTGRVREIKRRARRY